MATRRKRRRHKKNSKGVPPVKKTSFFKRKKSFSEKFLMVFGIIIALSMILSLFVSFGSQAF